MSFHNNPDYHIPELIEALKAHRLPHDTPSQLADSFRIGWMACRELAQADNVLEDAARLDYLHSTGSTIEMLPGEVDFYPMRFRVGGLHPAVSPNLREAIDAARKQGGV